MTKMLRPGDQAPALVCETLGHGRFVLASDAPKGGTLVVFHHGVACKWDRRKLKDLDDRIGDFAIRGVRLIAVSGDDRAAAAKLQEDMQLIRLPLAHDVSVAQVAGDWGLYTGQDPAAGPDAPTRFEPAQFWITDQGRIGFCAVQSTGNLWPETNFLLRAVDQSISGLSNAAGNSRQNAVEHG